MCTFPVTPMNMKKHLLLFVLLLAFHNGNSQELVPSKVSFTLRGKYIVFGFLEDLLWRSYSYGGTVQFGKHHSIGVDGAMFRTRFDYDSDDDQITYYSNIYRRTYIYIDYKYIFKFKGGDVYAQAYTKQHGRLFTFDIPRDDAYEAEHLESFQDYGRGKFTEYGGGVGALFYTNEGNGRFAFDVNLNVAARFGTHTFSRYDKQEGVWNYTTESDNMVYPYLRFTVCYHFFRYRK